jgi:hypothetical protein
MESIFLFHFLFKINHKTPPPPKNDFFPKKAQNLEIRPPHSYQKTIFENRKKITTNQLTNKK